MDRIENYRWINRLGTVLDLNTLQGTLDGNGTTLSEQLDKTAIIDGDMTAFPSDPPDEYASIVSPTAVGVLEIYRNHVAIFVEDNWLIVNPEISPKLYHRYSPSIYTYNVENRTWSVGVVPGVSVSGTTGPRGPQGVQGPQGEQGIQGEIGPQGRGEIIPIENQGFFKPSGWLTRWLNRQPLFIIRNDVSDPLGGRDFASRDIFPDESPIPGITVQIDYKFEFDPTFELGNLTADLLNLRRSLTQTSLVQKILSIIPIRRNMIYVILIILMH